MGPSEQQRDGPYISGQVSPQQQVGDTLGKVAHENATKHTLTKQYIDKIKQTFCAQKSR